MKRLVLGLVLAFVVSAFPAAAQWQVPSGSIPVGKGPGFTGFNSVTGSAGAGAKCLLDTTPPTFGACPGGASSGGVTYVDSGTAPCTAVGNGVTDDAPAIRACSAAVAAAGGGTVGFSCNKTYLLGSLSSLGSGWTFLHPYSNVTYKGCGDSSILKVKNGINTGVVSYFVFYPPDATITYSYVNIGFRDFKIENNGANNGGFNYSNVNIGCNFCAGILIDNVTFSNSAGGQYIQIGNNNSINAARVSITNNRFTDACDIINATCTDHSSIFIVADTYAVVGNSFNFSTQSTKATAIEMHGISGSATGNAIELYSKSANMVAQVTHTGKSLVFSGNASTNVRYGVQCWAINSQVLTDIIISTNTFLRSQEPVGSGIGFLDCGQSSVSITNSNSSNITISNNVISSSAAVGTAMTDPVIVVGQIQQLSIIGNTVQTSNGPCIGTNGNTVAASTSWIIKNNVCIDTGATSTAGSRRGILLSSGTTIDSIIISGNRIENVASAYMTTGIDINLNATYGYLSPDNQISNIATQASFTGTGYISYTEFGVVFANKPGAPPTSTAAMTNGQVIVGQTGAAPLPKTVSGDLAIAASGAATVGSFTVANDTTTNATMCPLWVTAASGSNLPAKASCTELKWNPTVGLTLSGALVMRSDGSGAGYYMGDRGASAANDWLFYAQANNFRLNNITDSTDWLTVQKVDGYAKWTASYGSKTPTTLTGTSGTVSSTDSSIIFNASGSFTATLPAAATYSGRWLYVKSIAAQTIASASSNVVPRAGGAAGTALLASGAGNWAILQSDGINWITMAGN